MSKVLYFLQWKNKLNLGGGGEFLFSGKRHSEESKIWLILRHQLSLHQTVKIRKDPQKLQAFFNTFEGFESKQTDLRG